MTTSSPCTQFAGVATCSLAVSWHESNSLRISAKFRPVVMGYVRVALILLSGPDDEYRSSRRVVSWCAPLGGVTGICRQHVVKLDNLQAGITDQRVVDRMSLRGLDVLRPGFVIGNHIDTDTDNLAVSLRELGLQSSTAPSSVVQKGVKSLGCEKSNAQPSPIHSWKTIGPSVVSAAEVGRLVVDSQRHLFILLYSAAPQGAPAQESPVHIRV